MMYETNGQVSGNFIISALPIKGGATEISCSRLRVVYVIKEKEMIVQATPLLTGGFTDTSYILIYLYWNLASTNNDARVTDLLSK